MPNAMEEPLPPLLKLPRVLRDQIYSEVLIEDDMIDTQPWMFYEGRTLTWQPPPLLQTCRRIRNEASKIYYGENTFYIHDGAADNLVPHLLELLGSLDPELRLALRCVRLGSVIILGDDRGNSRRGRTDNDMDEMNGVPREWIEGWANELNVDFARMKRELMRGRSEDEVCAEHRANVERDHARAAAEVLSRKKGAWDDASSDVELTPWTW
ncbi:hypothetical protein LTR48_005193 [Friedmanniomyces endolithicus]|uniref:WW domain-containing protein n=1 Tax=Rachicladosporium monterosium TaxID=1507873 RepID=A0ABR0L2U5_9PEZI|nr:hypothetical protein LTR48_005193 [Friedmanniomyces endolithicus]KAK5142644.1 hypothetical protein LTR32_005055 [Rachicladosporium monterosium]